MQTQIETPETGESVHNDPYRKTVENINAVCDLAQKCVELAENVKSKQRLDRIEQIAKWCERTATIIADDRFGTGAEPDYMADVASVAWELSELSKGEWPAHYVLRIARRYVAGGRQFEWSSESIDHPAHQVQRVDVDFNEIFSHRADPARIVKFTVDFDDWLNSLSSIDRRIAESLAAGETVGELWHRLELCKSSIYRIRSALKHDYYNFVNS